MSFLLLLVLLTGLCNIPPSRKLMAEATKKEQLIKRYEEEWSSLWENISKFCATTCVSLSDPVYLPPLHRKSSLSIYSLPYKTRLSHLPHFLNSMSTKIQSHSQIASSWPRI